MHIAFSNTYATLPERFFTLQHPQKVAVPKLFCFNDDLAHTLAIPHASTEKLAEYFSGNTLFEGSFSLAMAYAGHQFGHFTMLGDGRAVLLGEVLDLAGKRHDIQLKASGVTPYSRGGDGRGTLGAMLREYLISEAMHYLGIPTTRSLAVVETGEEVVREKSHKGAVLTRVASSHLRVGTFEYARQYGGQKNLKALLEYTIARLYPHLEAHPNKALAFLQAVMEAQVALIVEWMRVGFIHGVMNTDNMSISGETIDYGPCAFMNAYNPKTVFSSIDRMGRYRFENQPVIGGWNLSVLAGALLPLIDSDEDKAVEKATAALEEFVPLYEQKYDAMLCKKLGLERVDKEGKALANALLGIMQQKGLDYTNTFASLGFADKEHFVSLDDALKAWHAQWEHTVGDTASAKACMRSCNPLVIPRNHLVEEALVEAEAGNKKPFFTLLHALKTPYEGYENAQLQTIPYGVDVGYKTFCGT
ncbi:YdiU family protein [Sulfurospirillum sp. T05]|uniref:Protein nucleotidyltransferase YdiU n=1 Tax=Sulfurospirillum tamanense TaxID=2813362 RepID=A0ABS2WRI6_9BACT|nr:YdiU family protein [Sulfurospirillum tamanensis]MBN2964013.1 YdiU family protein [Sulfurospirillum tamanensis]